MDLNIFQDMVERNFSYLTNEFGFSMVRKLDSESFGNILLEYQSKKTFLRIALDKSQVIIDIKPLSRTANSWFGFPSLVEFLAPDFDETAYIFPEKWDNYDDMIEGQIERVARILRQYCEPILSGKFSKWGKVEKMRLKKIRREYKDITGKDYPL